MAKLSSLLVVTPDPSSMLISIKYGSQKRTFLMDPDWFASDMLIIFCLANSSAQPFHLLDKIQKVVLKYDVSNTAGRLKELSLSDCQHLSVSIIQVPRRSKFIGSTSCKRSSQTGFAQAKCSSKQVSLIKVPVSVPAKRGIGEVYSFILPEFEDYGPHRVLKRFHVVRFTAYCTLWQTFDSYVGRDYGQYPWGIAQSVVLWQFCAGNLRLSMMAMFKTRACLYIYSLILSIMR